VVVGSSCSLVSTHRKTSQVGVVRSDVSMVVVRVLETEIYMGLKGKWGICLSGIKGPTTPGNSTRTLSDHTLQEVVVHWNGKLLL